MRIGLVAAIAMMLLAGGCAVQKPAAPTVANVAMPSTLAAERAAAIKAHIQDFALRLVYFGPVEESPYHSLVLSVSPSPFKYRHVGEFEVRISEDQARKIIDYLAIDGFFDYAKSPTRVELVLNHTPAYVLGTSGGFDENLGWDLATLERLNRLRTVLEGDAARRMDELLGRMAEDRVAWTKQEAGQQEAATRVDKDRLQVAVTPMKETFGADEPLQFRLQFKNNSDKPFALYDPDFFWNWTIRFQRTDEFESWRLETAAVAPIHGLPWRLLLKPGEAYSFTVDLSESRNFVFARDGAGTEHVEPIKHLPPGRYDLMLIVKITSSSPVSDLVPHDDEWTGQAAAVPAEFEISDRVILPFVPRGAVVWVRRLGDWHGEVRVSVQDAFRAIVAGVSIPLVKRADALVKELSDPSNEVRAKAAEELRGLLVTCPSVAPRWHDSRFWKDRIHETNPGMTLERALSILLLELDMKERAAACSGQVWSGGSGVCICQLDDYWRATFSLADIADKRLVDLPAIEPYAREVWVKPPDGFNGMWVTWHVNGQKAQELEFRNGKYDGTLTTYYDDGSIRYQQHYKAGVCEGADCGWYRGGKKSYEGQYKQNLPEGIWRYWDEGGKISSETVYAKGKVISATTRPATSPAAR